MSDSAIHIYIYTVQTTTTTTSAMSTGNETPEWTARKIVIHSFGGRVYEINGRKIWSLWLHFAYMYCSYATSMQDDRPDVRRSSTICLLFGWDRDETKKATPQYSKQREKDIDGNKI